ncbi:Glycosyltransferase involved in cell wall bisynthesis [Dyella sp. OK004]|uniref:glycosyltransferase family 2 protein n=1 Tax=Dyella sp. OK004 TaxID=1855292 RepID=UPI0008F0249F|nr:glycosyltransferase family 2 protein [Dyella sp. OK004]SFS17690.1 Glycosyltransferase involved in cell wall bisynthesis [Dyella sp. OK004]
MAREPLSVVITTYNSAATLDACLASVRWADEIVVLDSGSTDATVAIATHYGARVSTQPFAGYSAQKQAAIDLAGHDWVLLLDSDEALPDGAAEVLGQVLDAPAHAGYQVWRREWIFWQWQSPRSRLNHYVRLFDRLRARMSAHQVHEEVQVDGSIGVLNLVLDHYGERDIAGRVDKANRYSSLQLADLAERRGTGLRLRLLTNSMAAFFRYYVLRGHYRSGWAGFIAARIHAFYAFLKYAKLYEATRVTRHGERLPGQEDG